MSGSRGLSDNVLDYLREQFAWDEPETTFGEMRMRWLVLGSLLTAPFLVVVSPARAQQETGNWVLEGCRAQVQNKGRTDEVQAQACIGGIRSIIVVGQANNEICPPDGSTEEQAIPIILKYVETHPINQTQPGETAYAALKAAWPCH